MKANRYLDAAALSFQTVFPLRSDRKCRLCEKPLAGKQTSWCSDRCLNRAIDEVQFRRGSSSHIRDRVFARDRGICAVCGVDGDRLQRIAKIAFESLYTQFIETVSVEDYRPRPDESGRFYSPAAALETAYFKFARSLWKTTPLNIGLSCWQADHILEVHLGGAHALDNLQTLCNLCHKTKTAEFNRKKPRKKPH